MNYAEASYFDGAHFQHIADYYDRRARALQAKRFEGLRRSLRRADRAMRGLAA